MRKIYFSITVLCFGYFYCPFHFLSIFLCNRNLIRYTVFLFNINDLALLLCLALPIAWFSMKEKQDIISYSLYSNNIFSIIKWLKICFLSVLIFSLFFIVSIISRKFALINKNILIIFIFAFTIYY